MNAILQNIPDQLPDALPPLTPKQQQVLIYLLEYYLANRFYPTNREVMQYLGVKGTTAAAYINPLQAKGYVQKVVTGGMGRNLRITNQGLDYLRNLNLENETKVKLSQLDLF